MLSVNFSQTKTLLANAHVVPLLKSFFKEQPFKVQFSKIARTDDPIYKLDRYSR